MVSFSYSSFASLSREAPKHVVPPGLSHQDSGVVGQVSSPIQLNTKLSHSPDSS